MNLETVATHFKAYVPSGYVPLEFVAFAKDFEIKIRAGRPEAGNWWTDALVAAARSLPQDPNLAEDIVKKRAAVVLGDPSIEAFHNRRAVARVKLAQAAMEAAQAESEEASEKATKHYRAEASRVSEIHRRAWSRNWDGEIGDFKKVVLDLYGKEHLTPYESSVLRNALESISTIRTLKEIAGERTAATPG